MTNREQDDLTAAYMVGYEDGYEDGMDAQRKTIEQLRSALKVIRTWASTANAQGDLFAFDAQDIRELCDKTLIETEEKPND